MVVMALRTNENQRYNLMKNRRSLFVNWIIGIKMPNCCCNYAIPAYDNHCCLR